MKYPLLLVLILTTAGCSTTGTTETPSAAGTSPTVALRPDVLYYANTPAGRAIAEQVKTLFGGQEIAFLDKGTLPPMDTFPSPISQAKPSYPQEMLKKKMSGTVTVEFIVGENGRVLDAVAIDSTNPAFNELAVAAIKKWTFKPATRKGVNIRTLLRLPVIFNLSS